MSQRARLRLPKEHGAWAMLYVPFAVGGFVAWSVSIRLVLLALSVTFLFIARESIVAWWLTRNRGREDRATRQFMIGYLALAALLSAPLLFVYRLYWLAAFGVVALILLVVNAQQSVRHKDRTIGGEVIAIAGLTLTAPAAHYVARSGFEATALWLWALCALYFASSVFYVKLRVNTINPRREEARRQSWRRCALYHSFLLAGLLVLASTRGLNLFALAAFSPILARSFWHLGKPIRQVNLRRVGLQEVIYSIVFLIFTTLTFRI